MPEPIVKILTVPLTPTRAFDLFTKELSDWWPLDKHSMAQDDATTVQVPDEVGRQVLETKPDGTTTPWGRVTETTPGKAFGMTWHVGRSEEQATHVRVTFDVVADGTKVTLVHDNWQVLGDEAVAMHGNYYKGWDFVFAGQFGAAAIRVASPQQVLA